MKVPVTFTDRVLKAVICSRANLVIENVALHQQVATLLKQRRRPILDNQTVPSGWRCGRPGRGGRTHWLL